MKASQQFIHTIKEAPAEAEVISHQLMIRAGFIQRVAGGIYSYLPLGLRILKKIEKIVREEINSTGAVELLMPAVQPAELWQESGRWDKFGAELLRFKDRHQRDFLIGPTHEEVITDIARRHLRSYRQLPSNLYQIQTKFRDEIRPRFGLMRGREFVMKDAYSFDRDAAGLHISYQNMYDAYARICQRMELKFRAVTADNGSIGGLSSHEFHVIAETGEDAIAYCAHSNYAANIEAAEALPLILERANPKEDLKKAETPNCNKCETVAEFLNLSLARTVKSIVLVSHQTSLTQTLNQIVLVLLRGDHNLNETKLSQIKDMGDWRFATETEIVEAFGTLPGYLGPIKTLQPVRVIADRTVANMSDFVCGANEAHKHFIGVNWSRDLPEPEIADIRNVVAGDPSPDGQGSLTFCRGIEVGHVFKIGTHYSDVMKAYFSDELGQLKPFYMGCYGIGISRLLGAVIEQKHDAQGMIWPNAIAPFELVICPLGANRSERVKQVSETLYQTLKDKHIDVILDDRGERPGVMFADWELIGVPHRMVISERSLQNNQIEYMNRSNKQSQMLAIEDAVSFLVKMIAHE